MHHMALEREWDARITWYTIFSSGLDPCCGMNRSALSIALEQNEIKWMDKMDTHKHKTARLRDRGPQQTCNTARHAT